jgi:hypothetical protein
VPLFTCVLKIAECSNHIPGGGTIARVNVSRVRIVVPRC